jgi:signal transduction histidine kinase
MAELEAQLHQIDHELAQLARLSLRSGSGTIGYRSQWHAQAIQPEWIQIHFDREHSIDEIVLIPTLWRDFEKGFLADGFPETYRILIGTDDHPEGIEIGSFNAPQESIGIAPVILPVNHMTGSWIRIEASKLSPRAFDSNYVFQLAEIYAFSGNENVALRSSVTASSVHPGPRPPWSPIHVVDGHTPYLMNSARGHKSLAYVLKPHAHPAIMLDLGNPVPVSAIHLYEIEVSNTVPETDDSNLGIPTVLQIEGANEPDFSDAFQLTEIQYSAQLDRGPIFMHNFPKNICRYIRITAPAIDPDFRLGFAEIEIISNGTNVAQNASVQTFPIRTTTTRSAKALTDGYNIYGKILPLRQWMNELNRRHQLETLRPIIRNELILRYAQQKIALSRMKWIAVLLTFTILLTVLIDQLIRQRQVSRIKERLAADLHDELGANLHAISLVSDLAKESIQNPDELERLLNKSRFFAERSATAARSCINMLEAKGLCDDLLEEMKHSANRLLTDLDHEFTIHGEARLHRLPPQRKMDLFFFFKECLTNVVRHSQASHVSILLDGSQHRIHLTVTDNGHGNINETPPSLRRRALLLGAKISIQHPPDGGTSITLKLKQHKWRIR